MSKYMSVDVSYISYEVRCRQRGVILVNYAAFMNDEEREMVRVTNEFIKKYIDWPLTIEKITCNNIDITKLFQDEQDNI